LDRVQNTGLSEVLQLLRRSRARQLCIPHGFTCYGSRDDVMEAIANNRAISSLACQA
jgi:hypothetical protein